MKIAINTYSLRNEWNALGNDRIGSVIKICKDLDILAVELLDTEYREGNLPAIVKRLADNGILVHAIAPHGKILVKPNEVKKSVEEGKKHLYDAKSGGIKYIRFQIGDGPFPKVFPPMEDFSEEEWKDYNENIEEAVALSEAVVNPLLEIAEKEDLYIALETHHSYSSNYAYMHQFNKKFNSKHIGWAFDIGNFDNDEMRWKGLEEIKYRTFYLHAKSYDYDDQGFEKTIDYPKACKILKEANFSGFWSIEFEGKMNGILGILKTNQLIKYSIATSNGQQYSMQTKFPSEKELIEKYRI